MNDPTPVENPVESSHSAYSRIPKLVHFSDLCRCGDEIWIELDGQVYRLRKTKQNKLILTK